jgi:hypothetical protein
VIAHVIDATGHTTIIFPIVAALGAGSAPMSTLMGAEHSQGATMRRASRRVSKQDRLKIGVPPPI